MRTSIRAAAAAVVASAGLLAFAGPSSAQSGPSLTVSPADEVAPGSMVTVSGSGYAPGGGIYVQFCAEPAGELGTAAGRADTCNPDQQNDHTVWKTPIDASGSFSVQLRVESTFGDTDCTTTTCGVFTRKDHMGGQGDFSQDAFVPVTFAAGSAPTSAPATEAGTGAGTGGAGQEVAAPAAELPDTGASPLLAGAAAAALLAGGALVVIARRRTA